MKKKPMEREEELRGTSKAIFEAIYAAQKGRLTVEEAAREAGEAVRRWVVEDFEAGVYGERFKPKGGVDA